MLRKIEVARRLRISVYSLDRWVKDHKFPPPIYLQPGSPATWRARDVEAFIEKRRVARRVQPKVRGMLKQNMAGEA